MKPTAFNTASGVSMTLFLVALTLCVAGAAIGRPGSQQLQRLPVGSTLRVTQFTVREWEFRLARDAYHSGPGELYAVPDWEWVLPGWLILSATAVLPAWWLIATLHLPARLRRRPRQPLRRLRHPPGHCHTCGYNLTGNASGVCPECGTAVIHPAPAEPSRNLSSVDEDLTPNLGPTARAVPAARTGSAQ